MNEHSPEFPRFYRLYAIEHRLTERGLDNAVAKGVITPEEKIEIMTMNSDEKEEVVE